MKPSWTVQNRDPRARFRGRWNRGLSTVSSKPHLKKNDLTVFALMQTVRCGFDGIPAMRFGAVIRNREPYGAVRCGFQTSWMLQCGSVRFSDFVNATVRFGAVFRLRECYMAVRCGFQMSWNYGAARLFYVLWCGSVRFPNIVKPTVRCCSVLKRAKILRCGSVRFTEPIGKNAPSRNLEKARTRIVRAVQFV